MIYQSLITYLQLTLAFLTTITLFNEGALLWIPLGIGQLIMVLYILRISDKEPKSYMDMTSSYSINILIASISFFLSSIYALYLLVDALPLKDKSLLALPVVCLIFLFAGNTLILISTENKNH